MALKRISTVALRREIARRERGATKLVRLRDRLQKKLAALERELDGLGGAAGSRRGRRATRARRPARMGSRARAPRAKNKVTLSDALASAVRIGATVSPADAAKRVRAGGYKSGSKTFGIQVATALAKHKGFKRTGRGKYQRVG